MNGLALCAGVGGMELGVKLALGDAYRAVCYAERDTYAASVLAARMQDGFLDEAPIWDDLGTFDGRRWRGVVHLVTAGYPCPGQSTAGKRLGQRDPRWLWPEVARVVSECRPGYVFLENVGGHLRLAFDDVWADLGAMGYEREAGLFSAAEVGAPHERERLFVLAYRHERGQPEVTAGDAALGEQWSTRRRGPVESSGFGASGGTDDGIRPEGVRGNGTRGSADSRPEVLAHAQHAAGRPASTRGGDLRPDGADGVQGRQKDSGSHRGSGEALAHAECVRGERRGAGGEVGGSPGEPGGEALERQRCGNAAHDSRPQLANASSLSEREPHDEERAESWQRARPDAGWGSLGPFPPGPGDRAGWASVLARVPEAQPAVCRLAHEPASGLDATGLAYRMDQLRCLGNGVVPMVAAHAFLTLAERLGIAEELGVTP